MQEHMTSEDESSCVSAASTKLGPKFSSKLNPSQHMTSEDESSCVSVASTKLGPTFSESSEWNPSQNRDIKGRTSVTPLSERKKEENISIERVRAPGSDGTHVIPGYLVDSPMRPKVVISNLLTDSKTLKSNSDGNNVSSERNPSCNYQMKQYVSNENTLKNAIKMERGTGAKLPLHSSEIYQLYSHGSVYTSSTNSPRSANSLADTVMAQRANTHSPQTVRIKEINDEPSFVKDYGKFAFGLLLLYAVLITALGSYSLKNFFSIPDLENEIRGLMDEVNKLEKEVDRLSSEIDRLDETVNRSETNNNDLEIIVSDLSHDNQLTHELLLQFNASNIELKEMGVKLVGENEDYESFVMNLNQTMYDLREETTFLNASRAILNSTVEDFKAINMRLQLQVDYFAEETQNLNNTVDKISGTLEEYKVENKYFIELNGNLSVIVDFIMGETSVIQKSYEELVSNLATIITVKGRLARVGLKDRMQAEIAGLECGLLVAFGTEPFIQNVTLSIGKFSYAHVIDYVNLKLFKDLCIDVQDFQLFLRRKILSPGLGIHEINIQDLTRGINMYTSEVINYYFYNFGEHKSMEDSDWEEVNYECNNLVESKKFIFVAAT